MEDLITTYMPDVNFKVSDAVSKYIRWREECQGNTADVYIISPTYLREGTYYMHYEMPNEE